MLVKLLEAGADPNAQMLDGCTPFILAVRTGNKEAVRILLADPRVDVTGSPATRPPYARPT